MSISLVYNFKNSSKVIQLQTWFSSLTCISFVVWPYVKNSQTLATLELSASIIASISPFSSHILDIHTPLYHQLWKRNSGCHHLSLRNPGPTFCICPTFVDRTAVSGHTAVIVLQSCPPGLLWQPLFPGQMTECILGLSDWWFSYYGCSCVPVAD